METAEQETELDDLIADQLHDDTETIKPEFREQVPFTDGLANCVGMDEDGEIVTNWPRPPRGTILVGSATWHGTLAGYRVRGCRCVPCTGTASTYQRGLRLRRKNGSA